jgi:hypothetical protein
MKVTMYNYEIKISYGASGAWKIRFEVTLRKVLSNVEWGFSGFLFYISIVFTFSPSSSAVHGSREDTKWRYEKQCSVRSFRFFTIFSLCVKRFISRAFLR